MNSGGTNTFALHPLSPFYSCLIRVNSWANFLSPLLRALGVSAVNPNGHTPKTSFTHARLLRWDSTIDIARGVPGSVAVSM